ncbi:MAG TPA: cytochrome ubiquinol oxidase subunit I [Propionibacteriaceae bacterium]|nr:cytochrome ubiquinol oxidase subunit I [Propionibacteriaceae bacterium]
MDAEILARWQFGITTVYHFFFVPITIALSMLVAVMQTIWVRRGDVQFLRLTRFFGNLFLINFAMGVVTGIVQEFQFGMNWSEYSRFVGDIFGAPLALEALIAFFLESTFIGLWIFGWDKLPPKLHLLTIYLSAIGTMISAVFILAANSWMQNPVGATYRNGRAELTDFGAVLTNPVLLTAFPHVIFGAYMTAGGMVAGICGLHLARMNREHAEGEVVRNGRTLTADEVAADLRTYRWGAKFGAWVLLVASVFTVVSGDAQGKIMTEVQPMKMAAAEALYQTAQPASFSIFTIGTLNGSREVFSIRLPHVLSFLATANLNGKVAGINDINAQYQKEGFRRDNGTQTELQKTYLSTVQKESVKFVPNIPVTYWTFRIMMGLGFLGMLVALWILVALRRGRIPTPNPLWIWAMRVLPFLPLFAISFGWIFTEMGRQPWIVAGVLPTFTAVSPGVSTFEVALTMVLYTLLYGVLAVVEFGLIIKYHRLGLPDVTPPVVSTDEDSPLSFAY